MVSIQSANMNSFHKKHRSIHRRCSVKEGVVRNFAKFTGKPNTCARVAFLKKLTLAQVFSCEFCEFLRTPFLQNTSGRLLLKATANYLPLRNISPVLLSIFSWQNI